MPRFRKGTHQRPQIPQVVVRIDDFQFGFENRFGHRVLLHSRAGLRRRPRLWSSVTDQPSAALAAESTARTLAVATSSSMPTPHTVWPLAVWHST
jgi:hypothetical protein